MVVYSVCLVLLMFKEEFLEREREVDGWRRMRLGRDNGMGIVIGIGVCICVFLV